MRLLCGSDLCHSYLVIILWREKWMVGQWKSVPIKMGVWVARNHYKETSTVQSWVLKAVMPHRVFQHITTRAHNFLHSATIFVYLECWYNPHVLSMCNSRTLINVDLLVKQPQIQVRDSHCFSFSYRQVKLSQLDIKWIIYLEKIYGWVAAT